MSVEGLSTGQNVDQASAWDSLMDYGVTQEQIDDMIQKGIDEPNGPEYQQALTEFGIKLDNKEGNKELTPEDAATLAAEEELRRALEHMEKRGDEDDPFAGERNFNDATGKERSRRLFDIYPQMKGESHDEYVARLHKMQELTSQFEEEEKEKAEHEGEEKSENEGKKKAEHEGKEKAENESREKAEHEGEEKARNEEKEKREARIKELEAEKARLEAEKRKLEKSLAEKDKELKWDHRLTQEQIDDMIQKGIYEPSGPEYRQALLEFGLKPENEDDNSDDTKEDDPAKEDELDPLVAIDADFTHDKKELAHDLAESALNEEVAKGKLIKRLWKGTLFKKYYEKKYTEEFMNGERTVDVDGKQLTAEDLIARRKDSAIKRFVLGATEDMRYIHEKIGDKRKDGTYDGEKLVEADKETTEGVRSAIEKFASAKIPEGGSLEDLKRDFANDIARLKAEARDQGKDADNLMIDNYLEVAIQARERAEHGIAIERVMEGFKVYNADVRDGIRTEAHRDHIDKVTDWLENHTGGLVPPQIIAGAVSIASAFTKTGARAVAGVAGGMIASSAISGLKERNRITEDRTRMLRDAANGLEYSGTSSDEEEPKGRRAKKIAKYEARIGGTVYEMQGASTLADNIENALNSQQEGEEKSEAVLRAIAEARVRIVLSDSEQKDLISYSSADKRGDERLKLDMAVIRAEKALSPQDAVRLAAIREQITREISGEISEKDKDFRHQRAVMAAKKAGKTLAIGAATFFASQEIMAAIDPNKIGLLEKAGIIKTENNSNASETILAGLAGPRVRTEVHTTTVRDISGDRQTEIQAYEKAGYTKTETSPAWVETRKGMADIDPAKSPSRIDVKYDGWANNGTRVSDGNELRAYIRDGQFVSGMRGNSTLGGQAINYESMAAAGRIKGYVTIGGAKFEIASKLDSAGQLTWGENGVFTTTTGETIRAIGENGEKMYKYFEIAVDNGVDASGITHIVPLATDVGRDTFTGTMQQITETIVEHPAVYSFTKTVTSEFPRAVTAAGIAFAPETARTGLGATRARAEREPNGGTNGGAEQEPTNGGSNGTGGAEQEPTNGGSNGTGETGQGPTNEGSTGANTGQEPSGENPPTNTETGQATNGEGSSNGTRTESGAEQNPSNPTVNSEAGTNTAESTAGQSSPEATTGGSKSESESNPDDDYMVLVDTTNGPEMYTGDSAKRIIEGIKDSESTPESQFSNDMKNTINNSRDNIGGEEGVNILTDPSPMTPASQKRWANWWSNLTDDGKRAVLNIIDRIESSSSKTSLNWGNGFRSWVAANRDKLSA